MAKASARPLRVLWVHDRPHADHPFLTLGLTSLAGQGHLVTVADDGALKSDASYSAVSLFPYAKRAARLNASFQDTYASHKTRQALYRDQLIEARLALDKRGWRNPGSLPVHVRRLVSRLGSELNEARYGIARWLFRLRRDSIIVAATLNLRAFFALCRMEADVWVASRPTAAILASVAAKLRGKRFVYYPFELYGHQIGEKSSLLLWLERLMLSQWVDEVITQNEKRAEIFLQRGSRRHPAIVHNYKRKRSRPPRGQLREALGVSEHTKIVLYEGQLIPGRWLDQLARASLKLSPDCVVVMIGPQSAWWKKNSSEFANEAIAFGRLIIRQEVPHDNLLALVADADVGIIIYDDSALNNMLCEPGKLSDYVLAGVPVVAPNFPTIAPVIASLGIGETFAGGTPDSIAAAINKVLKHGRDHWRPAVQAAADQLVWETQERTFVAAITGHQMPENDAAALSPTSQENSAAS